MHLTTVGNYPLTIGAVVAIIVLILAILGVLGVVPPTEIIFFVLIGLLAIARLV